MEATSAFETRVAVNRHVSVPHNNNNAFPFVVVGNLNFPLTEHVSECEESEQNYEVLLLN